MSAVTVLRIQLAGGTAMPVAGKWTCNEHSGNSEVLLKWLETQLGLLSESVPLSSRITEYASALDKVKNAVFAASLATDRWGTATELLSRRDQLRLGGWEETDLPHLPPLVRDLGNAAKCTRFIWPDESERLNRILAALNAGQVLGPHRCILYDPMPRWPARWQRILARLTIEYAEPPTPQADHNSALQVAQKCLVTGETRPMATDDSLQWIRSRSVIAACEAVAAALAHKRQCLGDITICCEDCTAALLLDGSLARRGLPTMGAYDISLAHPVLQILPLALNLFWEPVDPGLVLDFLSLPIGPIPKKAARRLAAALATQPGLGSAEWEKTVNELCSPANDPENHLRDRLKLWLGGRRFARGTSLPAEAISECAKRVAQWAAGYAAALEKERNEQEVLIAVLKMAAGHASTLAELAHTQGGAISEPQLIRLRDAAVTKGGATMPHLEAMGGPRLVSSLAEITTPCSLLVWLGLGTKDRSVPGWTALERAAIKEAGIDVDDGRRGTAALRDAERRGFCHVTKSILAVALPADEETRPHPVWLQIRGGLSQGGQANPLPLEDILTRGDADAIGTWRFPTATTSIQPPQPRRPLWRIDPQLLKAHRTSSATELQDRLACPLKWVFQHQAELYPSPIARLPDSFRLKGDFCHSVLERVLGGGGSLPSVEECARQVVRIFDERLPLDAAPLAQPHQLADKQRLRQELLRATEILVRTLHAGAYSVCSIEVEVSGKLHDRDLSGWIDCVGVRTGGEELVIDFKYGGYDKYREFLKNGRAVQLATYAYSRSISQGRRGTFPAVGYLILSSGVLYTPSGSRIQGDGGATIVDAPSISQVWDSFVSALVNAEAWLIGKEPVPARPLQTADQWPQGIELVLTGPDKKGQLPAQQDVCTYCNYQAICGLKELL